MKFSQSRFDGIRGLFCVTGQHLLCLDMKRFMQLLKLGQYRVAARLPVHLCL